MQVYLRQRRRREHPLLRDRDLGIVIVVAAAVGAALGSKLSFWFDDPLAAFADFPEWRHLLQGKSIVGGLLGGLVGVEIAKKALGQTESTGDSFVWPLAIGMSIGRVGCFLAGLADHTYGTQTALPWAIDFGDGTPRHPTQLYEIAFLLGWTTLIWRRRQRLSQSGDLFRLYLAGYLLFRLVIEFIKPLPYSWMGLSGIQWLCLVGLAYYLPALPRLSRELLSTRTEMGHKVRPYLYYDHAVSICSTCLRRVEGNLIIKDQRVFMDKWCPEHGRERVLIADDADYYRMARERFIKPPELPERFNTERRWGCPYDCGLCPEHMQHSCLTLVEVTDHCNLRCPICYADSGPHRPGFRDLATIERMLDAVVTNEGEPDVVQISGGEPTLHPDFFAILDAARERPIRHLMVNTNGLRIAREPEFVERLAGYMPGFELYLQFDSLRDEVHQELRGAKLGEIRRRALENLNRHDISTTLVVTVKKGLNDGELGEIIDFALQQPCVRGVTFQPIQHAGRAEGFDPASNRLTLTEVRRRIIEQSAHFEGKDLIPVPCNPDSLAMAYALKLGDQVVPLTGMIPEDTLINAGRNTIVVERDEALRDQVFKLFATNQSPEGQACSLSDLLCCLPQVQAPAELGYRNVFRVLIMAFIDAHSFDLRAVKKSCVHIAQPDGRIIPFDTFNLFYRDDRVKQLEALRAAVDRGNETIPGDQS